MTSPLLSLFLFFTFSLSVSSFITRTHPCVLSNSCFSHDFEVQDSKPLSHETIRISFAVKHKNLEQLYQLVKEVSDPQSPKYGKHWSFEQVGELTSDPEAKALVVEHLAKFMDVSQVTVSPFSSFIGVETTVETAEKILQGKFHKFQSKSTGEQVTRMFEFELPEQVGNVLDYVSNTVQFPQIHRRRLEVLDETKQRKENGGITPSVLNQYYNITSNQVKNMKATQSVFEFQESFLADDLKKFQQTYKLPADEVDQIMGKYKPQMCQSDPYSCMESTLDLEYIMSIAQKAPITYWNTNTYFSNWLEEVASTPNTPLVHSISWGSVESLSSYSEQTRFSEEAAKLGARGITIVVSSGDDGVAGFQVRQGKEYCGFDPDYPANVPYVLAVGATMGPETGEKEIACSAQKGSLITTGGGFSGVFERPDYQNSVVDKYLKNEKVTSNKLFPSSKMFYSSGRAYPDISLAGNLYWIIVGNKEVQVSGTSASAPVMAALLTLANNNRLNKGKPALGFVNPALYQLYDTQPEIFRDVTKGSNQCGTLSSGVCCNYGFVCASGWDPVTGLGSVNAGRLVEALSNL